MTPTVVYPISRAIFSPPIACSIWLDCMVSTKAFLNNDKQQDKPPSRLDGDLDNIATLRMFGIRLALTHGYKKGAEDLHALLVLPTSP